MKAYLDSIMLALDLFFPEFRKAGSFTNEEAVVLALKETLRYGLFLGTFAGTYVSVDEIIASFGGRKRWVCWNWFRM